MSGGPRCRTEKMSAVERFDMGDCGESLGLRVIGETKSSRHEVTRKCAGLTDSILSGEDGDEPIRAGNGCGVRGPVNESESTEERSSDGGDPDDEALFASTLAHMNRVVPVLASGSP